MAYRARWGSLSPTHRLHQEHAFSRWQAASLKGAKVDLVKFFVYPKEDMEEDMAEPTAENVAAAFQALPGRRNFKRS